MAEKIYNRNPAPMPDGTYTETKYATLNTLLQAAGSVANAVAQQNYATGMKLATEDLVNNAYKNNPESVEGFNAEVEKGMAKLEEKGILPGVMNKLRENVALNSTTKITAIESNIKKKQDQIAKIQASRVKDNWDTNMGDLYGLMYRAQIQGDEAAIKQAAQAIAINKQKGVGLANAITSTGFVYDKSDREKLASGSYNSIEHFKDVIDTLGAEGLEQFDKNVFTGADKYRAETGITREEYAAQRKYIDQRKEQLAAMKKAGLKNNAELAAINALETADFTEADQLAEYLDDDNFLKAAKKAIDTPISIEGAQKAGAFINVIERLEPVLTDTEDTPEGFKRRMAASTEILRAYTDFARTNNVDPNDRQIFLSSLAKSLKDPRFSQALQPMFSESALTDAMQVEFAPVMKTDEEIVKNITEKYGNNPVIAGPKIRRAIEQRKAAQRYMLTHDTTDKVRKQDERNRRNAQSIAQKAKEQMLIAALAGNYDIVNQIYNEANKEVIKTMSDGIIPRYEWDRLEKEFDQGKPAMLEYNGRVYQFQGFTSKSAIFK